MQLYKELWNAFNDIHFEEVGHKYTDSVGTKYTSVTTFTGQLEPDKDWDMIAEKASQKLGGKYWEYSLRKCAELNNCSTKKISNVINKYKELIKDILNN